MLGLCQFCCKTFTLCLTSEIAAVLAFNPPIPLTTDIVKYLSVFVLSMFKFVLGPITALPLDLPYLVAVALTAGGMMATVCLLTFAGSGLRNRWMAQLNRNRKRFSPGSRRMVRIWRKYGILGTAVLTPLLLTPIGGTLVAIAFGEKKWRIVYYMLASAVFWGFVITAAVYYLRDFYQQFIN